jgi:dTDP-4-dehydrorhamnose reductase
MKVYVAGAGGMLGEAVSRVFSERHELRCTDIDVNASWLSACDFRDFDAYKASVELFEPEILFHLGAHTDLEYCERCPDDAYLTNTMSVDFAATLAQAHGIPLIYISTAGIFDGQKQLYDDWDIPNPLGVYGRSKFLGETIVERMVPKHLICRAGWMMGGGPAKDKKFIAKLMKQLASGTKILNVVDDKLGTPTYTVDFARNVETLVRNKKFGLYNMVCGGETGRLEVAQQLIAVLGLEQQVEVRAVSSEFFAAEYFAPRPPSERLINYKLNLIGMNEMRDWRVALEEYVRDYYYDYVRGFAPNYRPLAR